MIQWFGRYIRRSIGSAGAAFCVLFTLSFIALSLHQLVKDKWRGNGFVDTLADISRRVICRGDGRINDRGYGHFVRADISWRQASERG